MTESHTPGGPSSDPTDSATPGGSSDHAIGKGSSDRIVGSSPLTQRAIEQASAAARSQGAVLIVGGAGVGKTHFARAVHAWSSRSGGPLVVLSAAASPPSNQLEELFGQTGSPGALARAAEGSVLIKGVDELATSARAAQLRAIEEGSFRVEGGAESTPLRARILMTSSGGEMPLPYARVEIAPLDERSEDIPALAAQFLATVAQEQGLQPIGFTAEARRWLAEEPWPGNVRELRERVRQALLLAGSGAISIEALMLSNDGDEIPSFKAAKRAFETRYVETLLRRCRGNISRAARLAKKDRKDFYDVIRRTGVNPQEFRS
jgi:two-component system response regulator GlrR